MKMKKDLADILDWHLSAGADEVIGFAPINHLDKTSLTEQSPFVETTSLTKMISSQDVTPEKRPPFSNRQQSEIKNTLDLTPLDTLEKLRDAMKDFEAPSLKSTALNLVFGVGAENASLMIIGEPPDEQEERQGTPFVGEKGQLLTQMLQSINLLRQEVYLTNVLPWRPPANRKPSTEELNLFSSFLRKHISLIRPKVLLLLGGSALSALLEISSGITKERGIWRLYKDKAHDLEIPVLASFSPDFLLNTPTQKKYAWQDLLSIKKKLESF